MISTINNLPAIGSDIYAFFDSPLSIEYTFPSAYSLSGISVKLIYNGVDTGVNAATSIQNNILTVSASIEHFKILPPNFKWVIYKDGTAIISHNIHVKFNADYTYNFGRLLLKTGEKIKFNVLYDFIYIPLPTPTPTPTPSVTPSVTPTGSWGVTPTPTPSVSMSGTPSPTPTATRTPTPTPSASVPVQTTLVYWGWKNDIVMNSISDIQALQRTASFTSGGTITVDFSQSLGTPLYLFMVENVNQPVKGRWYETTLNNEAINSTSTWRVVNTIDNYRVYRTAFQTEFTLPVEFRLS